MTRRVVTLPPCGTFDEALAFAESARRKGADLLELRTDLHVDDALGLEKLAATMPLLVAERGRPLPARWLSAAELVDREVGLGSANGGETLLSHHAEAPLSPDEALAVWKRAAPRPGFLVKHVEPLGSPREAARFFATHAALAAAFGAERVTVLATGILALPFRAALADGNALDYVALSPAFAAAPGQRLLEDARRSARAAAGSSRRGILGHSIAGSRSPRVHRQPFDRIDLPPDAPLAELLEALLPRYVGLSVTSPFKKTAARAVGAALPAVNTLVRRGDRFEGHNTDVLGAREALVRLGGARVTLLGDGGATTALAAAAAELGRPVEVLRRDELAGSRPPGPLVWTWPDGVVAPAGMRLDGARVGVIAYGGAGRRIATQIRALGGTPLLLGMPWFLAQARGQRSLWENAT